MVLVALTFHRLTIIYFWFINRFEAEEALFQTKSSSSLSIFLCVCAFMHITSVYSWYSSRATFGIFSKPRSLKL